MLNNKNITTKSFLMHYQIPAVDCSASASTCCADIQMLSLVYNSAVVWIHAGFESTWAWFESSHYYR